MWKNETRCSRGGYSLNSVDEHAGRLAVEPVLHRLLSLSSHILFCKMGIMMPVPHKFVLRLKLSIACGLSVSTCLITLGLSFSSSGHTSGLQKRKAELFLGSSGRMKGGGNTLPLGLYHFILKCLLLRVRSAHPAGTQVLH